MNVRIMAKLTFLIVSILIFPTSLEAGLDRFSQLDQIDDWIIERRVDSSTNDVSCRASKSGYGTWFGARVRLDKNDELLIPQAFLGSQPTSPSTITKVKGALKSCRAGLIYLPQE